MEKIGARLKELRKEKGLTQQQLADKLGLSKSAIIQYENNKRAPNFQAMSRLVAFFKVTPQYLSGESDVRTRSIETYLISSEEMKGLVLSSDGDKDLIAATVSYQNACNSLLSYILQDHKLDRQEKLDEISILRDIERELLFFIDGSHYKQVNLYQNEPLSKEEFCRYMENDFFLRMSHLQILIKHVHDRKKSKAYERYLSDYRMVESDELPLEDLIEVANEIIIGDITSYGRRDIDSEE